MPKRSVIRQSVNLTDGQYARLVKLAFSEEWERIGEWFSQIERETEAWNLEDEYIPSKKDMAELVQNVAVDSAMDVGDVLATLDEGDSDELEQLGEAIRSASYEGGGTVEFDYPPGHPKHKPPTRN